MLRHASRRLASLSSSPWRPNHSAALSATVTKSPVAGFDASSEKESRTSSFSYSSPFPSQFPLPSRGQVGAIQLGISRALQNWEPELRPPLKAVGFLTSDSRVVERKKPGKAKAGKSFQWVKR